MASYILRQKIDNLEKIGIKVINSLNPRIKKLFDDIGHRN